MNSITIKKEAFNNTSVLLGTKLNRNSFTTTTLQDTLETIASKKLKGKIMK